MKTPTTNCTHTKVIHSRAIVDHDIDYEPIWDIVREVIDTIEDIDIHRYKCTQCGEVFYYSERAKLFFEEGVECKALGLTMFDIIKNGTMP